MSLDREVAILETVAGIKGVPRMIWSGNDHKFNCVAMQYLGKDMAYYMKHFRKFSLKCVVNLAQQLLTILQEIHAKY
jgi:casein kinase I family protein HRR25